MNRRIRSSTALLVLTGALLFLLPVLAVLQYHWLGRLSEGERERMQANVRAATAQFAEAFARDFDEARTVFQAPQPERLPEGLADLAVQWRSVAEHPDLLSSIYYVHAQESGEPGLKRFDPSSGEVVEAGWSGALADLRSPFERIYARDSSGEVVLRAGFDLDRGPVLVVPQFRLLRARSAGSVPQLAYILLVFDPDYLRDAYLPALADRHFVQDDRSDYHLAVVHAEDPGRIFFSSISDSTGTAFDTPDASAPLQMGGMTRAVAVRSMAYRFSFETGALPEAAPIEVRTEGSLPEQMQRIVGLSTAVTASSDSLRVAVDPSPVRRGPGSGGSGGETPGTSVVAVVHDAAIAGPDSAGMDWSSVVLPEEAPWRLDVIHRAGSLDAAVGSARRRNLGVSFGILLLLGLSALMLVVATRREQQTAQQQMEFVAGVTHELRTPLAVIRAAGENLADGIVHEPDQLARYGRLIRDEGRRLTGMVEQTLELAGIRSGGRTYDLRPVAIETIVEAALAGTRYVMSERGFSVERTGCEPDLMVEADPAALQSAIENLIQNAVKYSGESRSIEVDVSCVSGAGGREAAVTVRDFGLGIDGADAERIFDPFYRAQVVRDAQIKGSGLGLSLVRTVVDRHGGRVELDSTPGEGSAFTIHLPVHTSASSTK